MDALLNLQFWQNMLLGLTGLIWQIALIVIPLMIFMEALKAWNVINRITGMFSWAMKPFSLPQEAVFPLLAGLLFGLVYGASFIIHASKEGVLTKRDLYLISLFLVINHSIIEDTLLFVAIGAKGWVVLTIRFFASIIITWLVGKFIMPPEEIKTDHLEENA